VDCDEDSAFGIVDAACITAFDDISLRNVSEGRLSTDTSPATSR
jgi:hypothetical protein